MSTYWEHPDFDAHEAVHFFHDRHTGLSAIIAVHSSALGPGAGGTRFWHYPGHGGALTDALRLSRGMSYKNAMAGLPMGGGKAVILANAERTKTDDMLFSFGEMIESLGGSYVTAEDVGMAEADMVKIAQRTTHICGLPAEEGQAGGDPGPFTAYGIYRGICAAVKFRLGTDSMKDVRVAIQGIGSVGGGVARLLARDGAKLVLADIDAVRAQHLAEELGGAAIAADDILSVEADVFSPNALGAILDDQSIPDLRVPIVAGGANNQLARAQHGALLKEAGILYAPDYVINGGGIINVAAEYLARRDRQRVSRDEVYDRLEKIPERLTQIWQAEADTGNPASDVADDMARKLIGRA